MNNHNIIKITDFNAPELDIYARMSEGQLLNRHEPHKGIFIAESPKVVSRALDAGCVPISILVEDKHIDGEAKDIIDRCCSIPIYTAPFDVLTKLTGFQLTRGILCAMHRPISRSLNEVCADVKRIAILHDVMNPTNVGAIFRSAAALGIDAVLLTPHCSDPLYRRAIRVSMGTVFQIPWCYIDSEPIDSHNNFDIAPTNYIHILKSMGFKTVAMALLDNSLDINDPRLMTENKLAIILGNEGDGLPSETINDCDYTVCIPMSHGVDSLNVAAASAVAFWQLGNHNIHN